MVGSEWWVPWAPRDVACPIVVNTRGRDLSGVLDRLARAAISPVGDSIISVDGIVAVPVASSG